MRRSALRLRPVNSVKHIVDIQGGLVAGTQTNNFVIRSVESPTSANVSDVEWGSTVSSIFLNVQVASGGSAALANVYMIVWKNPGGNLTDPAANAVGSNDNRKYVIHQEMTMSEKNATGIPRTLFKGVIRIPRGYKRFGQNDQLRISLLSPGVNFDFCIQCIYKAYK